jgi:hypothetical protein
MLLTTFAVRAAPSAAVVRPEPYIRSRVYAGVYPEASIF